jgi:exodeoxyribonuclease VII small subunit
MAEKKTFESQTAQLAEIVNTLQSGEASLDEAMKLFEKGVKLAAECNKMLDAAEKKVNMIIEETGEIVPFEESQEG